MAAVRTICKAGSFSFNLSFSSFCSCYRSLSFSFCFLLFSSTWSFSSSYIVYFSWFLIYLGLFFLQHVKIKFFFHAIRFRKHIRNVCTTNGAPTVLNENPRMLLLKKFIFSTTVSLKKNYEEKLCLCV